jgi:hypothetical protein
MHSIFLPHNNAPNAPARTLRTTSLLPFRRRVIAVPPKEWPLWIRTIAKFRRTEDTGIGDTIVHLIGDTRSESFKKWFQREFGKSCGCTERQRWLNQTFPYDES